MCDYEVHILRPGWAVSDRGGTDAACTLTLVKGPKAILVDVGAPWETELLREGLRAHDLAPRDIDVVVCTHGHSDHVGNLHLFPDALLVVGYDICWGRRYLSHPIWQEDFVIDEAVRVVATPGHSGEDVSVIVTSGGIRYGICGDLFESASDLEDDLLWRRYSRYPDLQARSRGRLLEVVDVVIPGHGDMFRVNR